MNLHGQIMNLNCVPTNMDAEPAQRLAYKVGHRDARHAAAELALTADAGIELLSTALRGLLSGCDYRSIGGDAPAWHMKSIPREADLDRARKALATVAR